MTGIASALALAARGFKVFPIKAGGKYPPIWRDWPNRATSDPQPVDFPDGCNVGIHAEGFIVVDADVRGGGEESLLRLDVERGWPATLTARTPTGGSHLFYRLPEGHPGVPNSASKLAPGLDIKSTRGYVVGVGSRTANGEYTWATDIPIAPAPTWLVNILGVNRDNAQNIGQIVPDADDRVVDRARDWIKTRPVGDEAYVTACGLRDLGLSEGQTLALMVAYDGRPVSVLAFKVRNAYLYATGEPGSRAVTADDFPTVVNNGQDLQQVGTSAQVPTPSKQPPPGPLRLADLASRRVEGPGYLVKGMLSRASYAEVYGPPGSGKTFIALDIAYNVAAGTPWMERKTRRGVVLYLAYEGVGGLVKRAQALRQKYGEGDVPLYVVPAAFNLREPAGRQALGGMIATLPEKPTLIVIDTFARALMGGDENSAQDVGAFNQAVAALIESTGACVMILHHTGKDVKRGARGSSALQGAVDTEIAVDGRMLLPTKQRDMEIGTPVGFKLTPVMVGLDEDDDEVTSCVVDAASLAPTGDIQLKGNQQRGWDALVILSPTNEPVSLDAWRDACEEFLGTRGRKGFYDIRIRLERLKLIVVEGGMVTRRME